MTVDQMQQLEQWDHVVVQFDGDAELEEGAVVKVGTTKILVCGEDEEVGIFYAPIAAANVIRKITPSSLVPQIDKRRIVRALDNIGSSLAEIKRIL